MSIEVGHNTKVYILPPNPKLDTSGARDKGITVLFCREDSKHKGHILTVELVKFLPTCCLVVSGQISTRFLQASDSDVLTSHYDLMSRIIEKHVRMGG